MGAFENFTRFGFELSKTTIQRLQDFLYNPCYVKFKLSLGTYMLERYVCQTTTRGCKAVALSGSRVPSRKNEAGNPLNLLRSRSSICQGYIGKIKKGNHFMGSTEKLFVRSWHICTLTVLQLQTLRPFCIKPLLAKCFKIQRKFLSSNDAPTSFHQTLFQNFSIK